MRMIFVSIALVVMSSFAFAQTTVEVDLSELDQTTATKILENIKDTKASEISIDQVNEWTQLALAIGEATNELCSSLNVQVNDFIQTPAGMIAIGLLAWKIVGASILGKLMSIPLYVFIICILLWSHRRMHLGRKIKTKGDDGKITETVVYYPWKENRYDESPAKALSFLFHALAFLGFTIAFWAILIIH